MYRRNVAHKCLKTVFLPGHDDILAVRRSLLCEPDSALSSTSFEVMILQSLVSEQEQRLVLATNDSPSCRRIILATNIAEKSYGLTFHPFYYTNKQLLLAAA